MIEGIANVDDSRGGESQMNQNHKKALIAFVFSGILLAAAAIWIWGRVSYESRQQEVTRCFKLVISGELKQKLPAQTVIEFSTFDGIYVCKLDKMPMQIKIPFETMTNRHWTVAFYPNSKSSRSEKKEEQLLAIRLEKELFDEPREIDIFLSKPKPLLCHDVILERMELKLSTGDNQFYEKMPHWDVEKKKLTAQASSPTWELSQDNTCLASGKMERGPHELLWSVDINDVVSKLNRQPPLTCTVFYKTGAFGENDEVTSAKIEAKWIQSRKEEEVPLKE